MAKEERKGGVTVPLGTISYLIPLSDREGLVPRQVRNKFAGRKDELREERGRKKALKKKKAREKGRREEKGGESPFLFFPSSSPFAPTTNHSP